jgi:hypothetical protein
MATHGPVTHLTSRLLTLRWLGTLRGLSPLSLAARMLSTPLTPLCAVRRSHRAGLLRRRSPHPRSRCSAQDPPAHRSPCMLHHTHLTPRSESGSLTRLRPGTGPTLHSLTQGSARPGPFAPLSPGPSRPLTSLTPSPSMQVNSTSRRHGARMARFVAPPPALLLLNPRCPHHRARPSPAKGKPVPHTA